MDELRKELLKYALDQDSVYCALNLGDKYRLSRQETVRIMNGMYKERLFSCYVYDQYNQICDINVSDFALFSEEQAINTWMAPTESTFVAIKN